MFGYCLSYSMFCMGVYLRWLILMIHQMPPQEYRGCSEDRCSLIQNVLHFNVMLNKYLMLSSCKANKLKSLKVAKWRKDEWRVMKDEWRVKRDEGWMKNDERWRMNDAVWWFQAVEGFWLMTDRQTNGHLWL